MNNSSNNCIDVLVIGSQHEKHSICKRLSLGVAKGA